MQMRLNKKLCFHFSNWFGAINVQVYPKYQETTSCQTKGRFCECSCQKVSAFSSITELSNRQHLHRRHHSCCRTRSGSPACLPSLLPVVSVLSDLPGPWGLKATRVDSVISCGCNQSTRRIKQDSEEFKDLLELLWR